MKCAEKIISADGAKAAAQKINFEKTVLTYVLWDRTNTNPLPIYVGTAKSKARIENHARKAAGNAKLARKSNHIEFAEFVERKAKKHGPGWIGFSLYSHQSFDAAKAHEVNLIEQNGLKRFGGKLFNRTLSG